MSHGTDLTDTYKVYYTFLYCVYGVHGALMLRHAGRAALPCVGSVTSSLLRSGVGQDCGCGLKTLSLEARRKLLFDFMA